MKNRNTRTNKEKYQHGTLTQDNEQRMTEGLNALDGNKGLMIDRCR